MVEASLVSDFYLVWLAGEELYATFRTKKGVARFSVDYSAFDFHTEISIEGSIEGRSGEVDTSRCTK